MSKCRYVSSGSNQMICSIFVTRRGAGIAVFLLSFEQGDDEKLNAKSKVQQLLSLLISAKYQQKGKC